MKKRTTEVYGTDGEETGEDQDPLLVKMQTLLLEQKKRLSSFEKEMNGALTEFKQQIADLEEEIENRRQETEQSDDDHIDRTGSWQHHENRFLDVYGQSSPDIVWRH